MERDKIIVKTSVIGILVNLILVAFKATIGIMVNSIAITLDAVNNLTDALSSIITIIGTKLAGKAPDKKHPYGYGRIEYFSSVIICRNNRFGRVCSKDIQSCLGRLYLCFNLHNRCCCGCKIPFRKIC